MASRRGPARGGAGGSLHMHPESSWASENLPLGAVEERLSSRAHHSPSQRRARGSGSPGGGHLATVDERHHHAHVDDIVHHFQELSAQEQARREAFHAQWDDRFAQFRAQCTKVEARMKDRHEHQLEELRAQLENNLLGEPPKLEELRRMQKVLVRHKRFGEALDLLKVADEKEAEEGEAHREKVRGDNVAQLQELFDRQAQERTMFMRECQAEEERLKSNKTRAGQLLMHEHSRRVEDEAARRMDALGSPPNNSRKNRAKKAAGAGGGKIGVKKKGAGSAAGGAKKAATDVSGSRAPSSLGSERFGYNHSYPSSRGSGSSAGAGPYELQPQKGKPMLYNSASGAMPSSDGASGGRVGRASSPGPYFGSPGTASPSKDGYGYKTVDDEIEDEGGDNAYGQRHCEEEHRRHSYNHDGLSGNEDYSDQLTLSSSRDSVGVRGADVSSLYDDVDGGPRMSAPPVPHSYPRGGEDFGGGGGGGDGVGFEEQYMRHRQEQYAYEKQQQYQHHQHHQHQHQGTMQQHQQQYNTMQHQHAWPPADPQHQHHAMHQGVVNPASQMSQMGQQPLMGGGFGPFGVTDGASGVGMMPPPHMMQQQPYYGAQMQLVPSGIPLFDPTAMGVAGHHMMQPPPPHFMPVPGTYPNEGGSNPGGGGTDAALDAPVKNSVVAPTHGPSGALARAAADDLMAAAMKMSGMGNHPKKISMEQRRRLQEEEAARPGSDDDEAEGIDDLDDVDLVAMTPTGPGGGRGLGGGLSGSSGGGNAGGLLESQTLNRPGSNITGKGSIGPGLNLDGAGIGGGAHRVVGIGKVGEAGVSSAGHVIPGLRGGAPVEPPPLALSRGVARPDRADGEVDPYRDMPDAAKGAAILKRLTQRFWFSKPCWNEPVVLKCEHGFDPSLLKFHYSRRYAVGPEDAYRSHRVSRAAGDPGAYGALGWVEEDAAGAVGRSDIDRKGKDPAAGESSTPLALDRGEHAGSRDVPARMADAAAARVPGLREAGEGSDTGGGSDGWGGGVGGGIDRLDSAFSGARVAAGAPVGGRSGGLAAVTGGRGYEHEQAVSGRGGGGGGAGTPGSSDAKPSKDGPRVSFAPGPPSGPSSGLGVLHSALSVSDDTAPVAASASIVSGGARTPSRIGVGPGGLVKPLVLNGLSGTFKEAAASDAREAASAGRRGVDGPRASSSAMSGVIRSVAGAASEELAAVGGDVGGGCGCGPGLGREGGDSYGGGGMMTAALKAKAQQDAAAAAARRAAVKYGTSAVNPPVSSFGAFSYQAGSLGGGGGPPEPPPSAVQAQENTAVLRDIAARNAAATGSRPPAAVPRSASGGGAGSPSGTRTDPSGASGYRKVVMPMGDDIDPYTGIPKMQVDGRAKKAMLTKMRTGAAGEVERQLGALRGDIMNDVFDDKERNKVKGEVIPATEDDVSVLFKHVKQGRYDDAKVLFKRGVGTNARDPFGNTPLIVACQNGQGRLAKMCLRYGGDVNLRNAKGNTALHFTVQYGYSALGDFLLEKGADASLLNEAGQTAYEGVGK